MFYDCYLHAVCQGSSGEKSSGTNSSGFSTSRISFRSTQCDENETSGELRAPNQVRFESSVRSAPANETIKDRKGKHGVLKQVRFESSVRSASTNETIKVRKGSTGRSNKSDSRAV